MNRFLTQTNETFKAFKSEFIQKSELRSKRLYDLATLKTMMTDTDTFRQTQFMKNSLERGGERNKVLMGHA